LPKPGSEIKPQPTRPAKPGGTKEGAAKPPGTKPGAAAKPQPTRPSPAKPGVASRPAPAKPIVVPKPQPSRPAPAKPIGGNQGFAKPTLPRPGAGAKPQPNRPAPAKPIGKNEGFTKPSLPKPGAGAKPQPAKPLPSKPPVPGPRPYTGPIPKGMSVITHADGSREFVPQPIISAPRGTIPWDKSSRRVFGATPANGVPWHGEFREVTRVYETYDKNGKLIKTETKKEKVFVPKKY
jgi:hypothetical protein